jgi:hypothetical protein
MQAGIVQHGGAKITTKLTRRNQKRLHADQKDYGRSHAEFINPSRCFLNMERSISPSVFQRLALKSFIATNEENIKMNQFDAAETGCLAEAIKKL